MPIGRLGTEVERGRYSENHIPGAKDAGEAYDLRYWRVGCSIGDLHRSGRRGVVTRFEVDASAARERTEYGEPRIVTGDHTVCILLPAVQVITTRGTRSYFHWYDGCCRRFGIEGDCFTLLEHVKDQVETQELRRPYVIRECVTDWPAWAVDKLMELLRAGAGMAAAASQVRQLLSAAGAAAGALDALDGGAAAAGSPTGGGAGSEGEDRPKVRPRPIGGKPGGAKPRPKGGSAGGRKTGRKSPRRSTSKKKAGGG